MAGSDDIPSLTLRAEEVEKYCSLRRGDHLAVAGDLASVTYYHHGIFLGHDTGVCDFGADDVPKTQAKPRIIDLYEFNERGKRHLFKLIYPTDTCQTDEAAAHCAEEVVEHPDIWGPYHLTRNNCEHFATRCKTGKAYSLQVEDYKKNPMKLARDSVKASFNLCFGAVGRKDDTTIN